MEDRAFFRTIWSNRKSKDIFDAKMAYGQQHFLVWFFIPATPSYTSFSDFSPSVTRSFIRKKLFFENFMLWYLCCRIWNYGDYGPLGYDLSCCGSHCSVSSTFIRIHLIPLCVRTFDICPEIVHECNFLALASTSTVVSVQMVYVGTRL